MKKLLIIFFCSAVFAASATACKSRVQHDNNIQDEASVSDNAPSKSTDLPEATDSDTDSNTASHEDFDISDTASSQESSHESPAPEIILPTDTLPLGEVFTIHILNAALEDVSAETDLPFQPRFFNHGEQLTAFLPISYYNSPGNYSLRINIKDEAFDYTVCVSAANFEVQHLTIDSAIVNSTNTNEGNTEWETRIEPLKLISDTESHWEGQFIQPVYGEITTQFGMTRYTNGSSIPTIHSGIDIAAKQGSPIAAANNGRILFADYLILTGNTVIIEHGFGLKSFYYHMDSLSVNEGQFVKKGDLVGTVGSTGYSTGPHLHYSLLVNDVFVNPWTAFEKGFE
ncbi:MAG: M23 family metallopeptidase [Oscillospiraceae bacterium]|nr:M23 family metallopeptidase [Oscillospiraceae bacterium]